MSGTHSSPDRNSSSSCTITHHLALNHNTQSNLQAELDQALVHERDPIASSEIVKRLPYYEAVINKALRMHSTASLGLPCIVPEGGLSVSGKMEGTVLSVPSYTIHRVPEVWGHDVEAFRPERWFEQDKAGIQKTFNPFSFGPRPVGQLRFRVVRQ
jgi:benzoate 4-monooxygenase